MATVLDLISASLREIGILQPGEVPESGDATDALAALNRYLDEWATQYLTKPELARTTFPITANLGEYLIGLGLTDETEDGFDTTWTGAPDDWTDGSSGTSTVTNDSAVYQAGGHSVKLDGIGGDAVIYRDFTVLSGEEVTVSVWGRATFTSTGFVRVRNLTTTNYLTASGNWQTLPDDIFEADAGVSFVEETLTFTVESAAAVGATACTLRVSFRGENTGNTAWFDTFAISATSGIPIPRPVVVEDVRIVDTSQSPDLELSLTMLTDQAWEAVPQKDLTNTWPTSWYYNPTFPYGTLQFWPIPTSTTLQGAIYVKTQISEFDALSSTVTLPPAYFRALVKNLALDLCPSYGKEPSGLLLKQAADSLASLKRANIKPMDLGFPGGALVGRRRGYDIRSDRW